MVKLDYSRVLLVTLYSANATLNPFLTLILQDYGLSVEDTGLLVTIARISTLLLTPLVCAVADRSKQHAAVLVTLSICGALLMFFWATCVPPHYGSGGRGGVTFDLCFVLTAGILCLYGALWGSKAIITDSLVLARLQTPSKNEKSSSSFSNTVVDTKEETEAEDIKQHSTPTTNNGSNNSIHKYPLQRLWGSIAYGVTAFCVALLLRMPQTVVSTVVSEAANSTTFSSGGQAATEPEINAPTTTPVSVVKPYMVVPYIHGMFLLIFAACVLLGRPQASAKSMDHADYPGEPSSAFFSKSNSSSSNSSSQSAASNALARLRQWLAFLVSALKPYVLLMREPRFALPIFSGCFFLSLSEVAVQVFLYPYLRRELKATPEFFSLVMITHMTSEILAFRTASSLLKHVGCGPILVLSAVSYTLRMIIYTFATQLPVIFLAECLQGPCISFCLSASVAHVTACVQSVESRGRRSCNSKAMLGVVDDVDNASISFSSPTHNSPTLPQSSSSPTAPTLATPSTSASAPIIGMSTALSIYWFATAGLSGIAAGLLPLLLEALRPQHAVHRGGINNSSLEVEVHNAAPSQYTPEKTIFAALSVLLALTSLLFVGLSKLGWLG